jgi:hypothetical protein
MSSSTVLNDNPADPSAGGPVIPGDYFDFDGQVYQVVGFPGGGGLPPLAAPSPPDNVYGMTVVLSRWIPTPVTRTTFVVVGKPRRFPGEKPQSLPRGVVIDFSAAGAKLAAGNRDLGNAMWMSGLSTPLKPDKLGNIDIMFSPSGQVVGDAVGNDIIYLWLHPSGEPNNWKMRNAGASLGDAGNQSLVVIYSRTGNTGTYPVDQRLPGQPFTTLDPNPDPFSFAKSARARSAGGL